ncbi:MAG: hypothetical protein DVB31_11195 [Verrucomicrobia bacterium]|nr:MAG: hypothetical protein DVB31_11195 [Verrucomicrobiota bacterium]
MLIAGALAACGLHADTIAWKTAASGNWNDATKWSSGTVPGSTDTAVITNAGNYTVTVNVPSTVSGLLFDPPSGAAIVQVTTGSLAVSGTGTLGSQSDFRLTPGGVLGGAGSISTGGKFTWSGGQIEGAGKLTFAAGSTVDVVTGGQHSLRDRHVFNASTVNWSSLNGDLTGLGATWKNEAGSTLDLKGDVQIVYWAGTPVAFQNDGSVRKSAGTGTGYLDWKTSNTGTVEIKAGTLNVRQGFEQTAGQLLLSGGNIGGNVFFGIKGGIVEGSGLVDGLLHVAGEVRPGGPLGRLRVSNAYSNSPTARTVIQLGGTDAGTNADQIAAVGPLTVAGELAIQLANGFEPGGADSWVILSGSARTGTFSVTNAPSGFSPTLAYTSTNVTLRLVKTAVAKPEISVQPASIAVDDGSPALFSVTATGADLVYQWRRNGVPIPGATGPTLGFDPVRFSNVATYTVLVSNAGGSVPSEEATLKVNPTGIDSGLLARYPLDGNLVDVVGGRNGTTNGTAVYVATGSRDTALRLDGRSWIPLGVAPADPIVDPSLPFSAAFWIRPRALREVVPIRLATVEGEFAVYLGSGVSGGLATHFGFRGQNSPATTDYRAAVSTNLGTWTHVVVVYKGGPKGDNASFAAYINGQSVALDGQQTMTGGNGSNELGRNVGGINGYLEGDLDEVRVYGRALRPEDAVELAANPTPTPPEFIVQPVGANPTLGNALSLGSLAIGNPLLSYQWYKDDAKIEGATTATYNTIATADGSGTYRVEAKNGYGTAKSSNAVVNVFIPPPPGLAGIGLGIPNTVSGASFLGQYNGFASFRAFGGSGGGVCRTINGGLTWVPLNIGVSADVNAVQWVGSAAYIAGSGGLLCISTNAGASWTPFAAGTAATFNGLCFQSPTSGWAVGSAGTICRYNGTAWTSYPTGIAETFYGVAFDGGPGGVAWAVGSGGTICRYNGSGWSSWPVGTGATFYGVSFLNPNLGFAVGSGGTICRYNGTAWVALNTGTTGTFRSVVVADANTVYAAGDNGLFCVSRDGGNTWLPLGLGSSGGLGALAYNSGRVFLFGAGGAGYSLPVPGQVLNLPPTVQIVSPVAKARFFPCREIPVVAVASDPDGTVVKVEFFRGQYKLAEYDKPPRFGLPFRTPFYTDALGTYEFRAVATDNLGAVTVSDPVQIEVVQPPEETAAVERFTEEGCALCYFGWVGTSYVLEATTNAVPPTVWVPISTNAVPEPFLRVTDAEASGYPYRFYRFRRIP